MRVVGLTGGIGSGKSTVARLFAAQGAHWVDADIVAREVVEPGTPALEEIAAHFGRQILASDGSLDRAALRSLIFQDANERQWLEQLLHPIIRQEIQRQLHPAEYGLPYVLLVSPLLLETDQHQLVDLVVVVDVPVETQVSRTVERDSNTPEQVRRIVDAQMDRETRKSKADVIIDNQQPPGQVEAQILAIHRQFLSDFEGT